ncbi:MAG: aldo/keto reductase [Actinomycetota bacterium]
MQHVRVGSSGLVVSRICLGTGSFGGPIPEAQACAILDAALDRGITTIDTADVYPHAATNGSIGATEELIGRWMKGRRDEVVIATKGSYPTGPRAWQRGNGRRHLREAVEASLRRLDTDHIDLYLAHADDPSVDLDETLGVLDDLTREGKILHAGVSNWPAWRLGSALGRSLRPGIVRPLVAQTRYSLLHRAAEQDLFVLAQSERLAVFAYNTLYGGLLSSAKQSPVHGERPKVAIALDHIARSLGRPLIEIAYGWALSSRSVTGIIVSARRDEHLDAAVAALDSPLEESTLRGLDELTQPWLGLVPPP